MPTTAGAACAVLPGLAGILLATVPIGAGTGLITTLGFAALTGSSRWRRSLHRRSASSVAQARTRC
ncbi:hypothetical protein [Streptomyces sp. NPDC127112]|uniref:hypothetical protein n=1 Tax=Streptomyces sp. NPDC127112 TaxID=3345364 RepID=UPI00362A92DB